MPSAGASCRRNCALRGKESINLFTRVQGRQMSLDDVPTNDLYLH